MQVFEYKGRNKRGELMQGTIDSTSTQSVASWLMANGISPIEIKAQKEKLRERADVMESLFGNRVSHDDLLLFTRQVGAMVRAGVPMLQILTSMQQSTVNPKMLKVIKGLRTSLDKGTSLSYAMAQQPKVFSDYYVNMVRVGEGTGLLDEALARLFKQLEFDKEMRKRIASALRYPSFVMLALVAAMVVMMVFVIPKFAALFANAKMELPLLTRVLIGGSNAVSQHWELILLGLVVLVALVIQAFRYRQVRYHWDRIKLSTPIIGGIVRKASLARFCQGFATAMKSGVPIVQAFNLVSRVVDNVFYEDRILGMAEGVERGESLVRVAKSTGIFKPMELQMIAVGEETGDIDGMLDQVAQIYEEEVRYEASRLSSSLEPILLGVMAMMVGVLLIGFFVPMINMSQIAG